MAINLSKSITATNLTWTDFYINMYVDMENNATINTAKSSIGQSLSQINSNQNSIIKDNNISGTQFTRDLSTTTENFIFASQLTTEYDKVIRNGGKTILGGVSVKRGNTALMQSLLINILGSTKLNKNGDLLRDIGPAVQAYWLGAQLDIVTPPNIPCPGSLKNIQTLTANVLYPGNWIPIPFSLPMMLHTPWLLQFIASATLHLFTVGGLFTCLCQYPPPAPPAPGVLPWAGYFVPPIQGKLPEFKKDIQTSISIATSVANAVKDFTTG